MTILLFRQIASKSIVADVVPRSPFEGTVDRLRGTAVHPYSCTWDFSAMVSRDYYVFAIKYLMENFFWFMLTTPFGAGCVPIYCLHLGVTSTSLLSSSLHACLTEVPCPAMRANGMQDRGIAIEALERPSRSDKQGRPSKVIADAAKEVISRDSSDRSGMSSGPHTVATTSPCNIIITPSSCSAHSFQACSYCSNRSLSPRSLASCPRPRPDQSSRRLWHAHLVTMPNVTDFSPTAPLSILPPSKPLLASGVS